ncbi:MAG TPA: hypothetical protein PJ988_15560 [Anaerolinea sp.]|nr:hypothetical protein [Anaerolinea sp.]
MITVPAVLSQLLPRRGISAGSKTTRPAHDTRLLILLLWLAGLCILAYVAFVFGKR